MRKPTKANDPFGRRPDEDRVFWAPDDHYVAALVTLARRCADPDELREFALMLGYGEPETRRRYENGLRARQSGSEGSPGVSTLAAGLKPSADDWRPKRGRPRRGG
jgi:hypothetical protein